MQELLNETLFLGQQYLDLYRFLIPLGVLGLWRWSVWVFKEMVALRYRPKKGVLNSSVSVVSPVYNEDPEIFDSALRSWRKNHPLEIIAVIDSSDRKCISVFKDFKKGFNGARLIITDIQGKRPALALGIKAAKGKIVALVDSDTLWSDNLLREALPPFKDPLVSGVATYQNVLKPKTFAQKVFDTQLDLRYCDDFPFLAAAGDALVCLSGRTALYRRSVVTPLLPDLVNETFLGEPVISGDDKRLTYLVLAHGWKVAFQSSAKVYTPGMENLSEYLKQRLRWSRNSIRADLAAMAEGWPLKHPALFFFQIDKVVQTFATLVSPIYFSLSLLMGLWVPALVIALWWIISRTIKIFPHLKRRPEDITILPLFIAFAFLSAVLKLYALFTLNTQGWITRWDPSRLPKFRFLAQTPAYLATASTIFLLAAGIYYYQLLTYFYPFAQRQQLIAEVLAESYSPKEEILSSGDQKDLLASRYVVLEGDTLSGIAQKYGIDTGTLLAANISRLPNWNSLQAGLILSIPGKDTALALSANYNYQRIYSDPKRIVYNPATNTVEIFGRGQTTDLDEIAGSIPPNLLSETAPKEWFLQANIFLHSGTTLVFKNDVVRWLKLKSSKTGYVSLLAYNAVILADGVKITSWDEGANGFDENLEDGRSFILVKDGSRMDLYRSELAYLGFPRKADMGFSPYGVSWRMSSGKLSSAFLTGEVIESNFHHNYFGAYTFGATGMTWKKNKFHDNIRYGLDPHDDSNGFLVEDNLVYNNGSHGIIFSKRCNYNIIRGNLSYNNKLHGVMLHADSNFNRIENNTLSGNFDGVALWGSNSNLVANNKIYNNRRGIRANQSSKGNIFQANTVTESAQYGIYLYGGSSGNKVEANLLSDNPSAVYIKSPDNLIKDNTIKQNRVGVYLSGEAGGNVMLQNDIIYNSKYGIYAKARPEEAKPTLQRNFIKDNRVIKNHKDIFAVKEPERAQ